MIERNNPSLNILMILLFFPFLIILIIIPLFLNQLHFSLSIRQFNFLYENKTLQSFTIIFVSILLEAIPFIIIGTFVSSLIQIFITDETIAKYIPKSRFLGTLCAALIGLIFPVCDCAIVPIVRRLIKKGLPLHIGITFMLAVPIVNPITLSSTYYAFSNNLNMLLIRGCLGFISAMIIGSLISSIEDKNTILKDSKNINLYSSNKNTHIYKANHNHSDECACGCGHLHRHSRKRNNPVSIALDILDHTTIELHDVGRFVIIGAFLSALMQTFISRKYILLIGQHNVYSVITMIGLSFMLAICSQTDAFIARTFVGQFTTGSIIAFLIFGPMIDIKNTLMLSSAFKGKFIIKLIFFIFSICFIIGAVVNLIIYKGGFLWPN